MQRIDHATAAANLPTPSAPGTAGYFTAGDPITNTPATIVSADWLNLVQEELIAVVNAGGLTPSKTTRTQVRDAVQAMIDTRRISVSLQCVDPAGVLSVSRPGLFIVPPELDGYVLSDCALSVGFPRLGATGQLSVQLIRFQDPPSTGNNMLSTPLTLATGDQLAHNAVIDPNYDDVSSFDLIAVSITSVWSGGTLGTGLTVLLVFDAP